MTRLRAGVASDRGLVRSGNEDSYLLRRGLYAVCDGMGGARGGEVASQMACLALLALDPAQSGPEELRAAIAAANEAIVSRSIAEEHLQGMGTTLTAVLLQGDSLMLAHIGDSRAYLFREGSLIQLTDDHSWVAELVRRGELTPAQAAIHPHRSVITRVLGAEGTVDPDVREMTVEEGDRILLCSDGLTGMVSDEEIAELLGRDESPRSTAELLVEAALARGGEDNVTAVVVDVLPDDQQGSPGDHDDDQVGNGVLIGPSDRGELAELFPRLTRGAGVRLRRRLSRRIPPVLRPVGSRVVSAPAAGTGAETPPKRPRRKRLYVIVAVVIVLAVGMGGFAIFNSSVYYVGMHDDGTVALYRGLPASCLGVELSSVVEVADVKYESLAPYLQVRVDAHDLLSKEEGRAFLKALGVAQ